MTRPPDAPGDDAAQPTALVRSSSSTAVALAIGDNLWGSFFIGTILSLPGGALLGILLVSGLGPRLAVALDGYETQLYAELFRRLVAAGEHVPSTLPGANLRSGTPPPWVRVIWPAAR